MIKLLTHGQNWTNRDTAGRSRCANCTICCTICTPGFRHFLLNLTKERSPDSTPPHLRLFHHSIVVHLLRGGANIRYTQEFHGHSSLETIKIYLRVVSGRLKEEHAAAMPIA